MNTIPSDYKELLNNIDLNKGDTVMLVSDITKLIIEYKKKHTIITALWGLVII